MLGSRASSCWRGREGYPSIPSIPWVLDPSVWRWKSLYCIIFSVLCVILLFFLNLHQHFMPIPSLSSLLWRPPLLGPLLVPPSCSCSCCCCCCCCCRRAIFFIWGTKTHAVVSFLCVLIFDTEENSLWIMSSLTFALWFWNHTCTTRTVSPVSAASVSLTYRKDFPFPWF